MTDSWTETALAEGQSYVRPGSIQSGDRGRYRVLLHGQQDPVVAISALAQPARLMAGDHVLVTGEVAESAYIIGVLGTPGAAAAPVVRAREGASARVVPGPHGDRVRVENAAGRMLFELDARTGASTVSVPDGDLTLCAPRGNIQMVSGGDVVCSSRGSTILHGGETIDLRVRDRHGSGARLRLDGGVLQASSADLRLDSESAAVHVGRAEYRGSRLSSTITQARFVYERVETIAVRLIERVKDAFRTATRLARTKAGRARTVVDGDYRLRARQVDVRAEQQVKIDGDRINLG